MQRIKYMYFYPCPPASSIPSHPDPAFHDQRKTERQETFQFPPQRLCKAGITLPVVHTSISAFKVKKSEIAP